MRVSRALRCCGAVFGLAILALVPAARAVDKAAVQEQWRTPFDLYLDPREAFDMKSGNPEGVLFVDVRSRAELQFVGYPGIIDANIPIFLYEGYEWKQQPDGAHGRFAKHFNTDFVAAVDRLVAVKGKDRSTPIIVMCQSGSRAPIAARELHGAGYREVYTQYQGFEGIKAKQGAHQGKRMVNGWKLAGLPWIYRLETAKMYFNFAPGDGRAPQ